MINNAGLNSKNSKNNVGIYNDIVAINNGYRKHIGMNNVSH